MSKKNIKAIFICLFYVLSFDTLRAQEQNEKQVLIVMDMQKPILKEMPKDILSDVKKAIEYARMRKIQIIYVRAAVRPGAPEVSLNNKFFKSRKEDLEKVNIDEWVQIHESITPKHGDIIVDKRRFSSFEGTDLDILLRSKGYNTLVLCGVMTSGVVLSTVRDAADRDYKIKVLSNGCADPNPKVTDFLMKEIFPLQADVLKIEEWIN